MTNDYILHKFDFKRCKGGIISFFLKQLEFIGYSVKGCLYIFSKNESFRQCENVIVL